MFLLVGGLSPSVIAPAEGYFEKAAQEMERKDMCIATRETTGPWPKYKEQINVHLG